MKDDEDDLDDNNLALGPTLQLRTMAIGQLSLRGNPLLTEPLRVALGVKPGVPDARALRSFLVDQLPCVIAIDGSFVTSVERHDCRAFFSTSTAGLKTWGLLLASLEDASAAVGHAAGGAVGQRGSKEG